MSDYLENKIKGLFPYPPRGKQLEIVTRIIQAFNSGKQHVVLSLPTGGGKSVIAFAVANYFKEAYVLTNQKVLQEQYKRDLHVPYILGRSNYICNKNNSLTCEMGVCKRVTSDYCHDCPYIIDRNKAKEAWFSNMNYSYFLNLAKARNIPKRNLLVLDESHCLENELIQVGTIKLNNKLLKYLDCPTLTIPAVNESDSVKQNWLFNILLPDLKARYNDLRRQIKHIKDFGISKSGKALITKFTACERMVTIISEIESECKAYQRVIITSNEVDETIEYKVLYGYNLFEKYFSQVANKFLHMSATILNKEQYCKKLNLDYDDVEYLEYESDFPVENRLIHFTPVGSLSWKQKSKTIPKLIKRVEELLNRHNNEKGIIHTVNYELAEIICDQLYGTEAGRRLLMPKGKTRQTILETFYKSDKPYVLISPSLTEGLDLKDDLSRFCIICKMPYANISDKWIKTRMNLDVTWYNNFTAESLIQMTGRSIRSKTDFATTYILDEDFLRFAETNYYILPNWWKDAVVTDDYVKREKEN